MFNQPDLLRVQFSFGVRIDCLKAVLCRMIHPLLLARTWQ